MRRTIQTYSDISREVKSEVQSPKPEPNQEGAILKTGNP
jgi:hypothetical protein